MAFGKTKMPVAQTCRTSDKGRVNPAKTVSFTFDGKDYQGYEGDTLASALLANNVHLVGRSFKYHRPRGILSAGSEEPNALIRLGKGAYAEPNLRATDSNKPSNGAIIFVLFKSVVARFILASTFATA